MSERLSKHEQNKREKRRRIIEAALSLFAERGFHGTAVPLVASAAGVGAGTIYRHFRSKEELVNEVFREAKGRLRSHLEAGLGLSDSAAMLSQEPRALFESFWWLLVSFARSEPVAFHFLEMQDHVSYLDASSQQLEREVLMPLVMVCQQMQSRGVFRPEVPIDAAMALIWGAFVGLFKAERLGYLTLTDDALTHAGESCWRAFAIDPDTNKEKRS